MIERIVSSPAAFPFPAPERIAIFRALQLGDMLCAVPALRALRRRFPHAQITLIGLPWALSFAHRYADLIDDMLVFPGAPGFPEQPEIDDGLPAFYAEAGTRRFDLAIQLHGSGGVANHILFGLGARDHAGFVEAGEARPGCFIRWPDDLPEPERYNALMRALAIDVIDPHPSIPLTRVDHRELAALIAEHGIEPGRLVIVHPGAQLLSRRWPAERFAAVADALAAQGWQIAITGSAGEAALTGMMLGAMAAPALHLAGRTSLGGLAALVQRARLVVCNDTGVSHVAAAMKTRSVVVACGSDTRRWAPLDRERHRVLADWPACRPCMYRDCPFGHPCALNVDVNEVVAAALAQLSRDDQAHPAAPFTLHAQEWDHAA
jgi:ADP-heptose:LPS heptosyltransferase